MEACGWEVWWDERIRAGDRFDRAIEQILPKSTCVVVLWSSQSVESDFVRSEARWAAKNKVPERFPVLVDNVQSPFGIGSIQAAKLAAWDGDGSSPTFFVIVAILLFNLEGGTKDGTL